MGSPNVGVVESHFIMGCMKAGGICGWLGGEGIIRNCYNKATVEGSYYVGGICGSVESDLTDCVVISNCYNAGEVIGAYSYVGGLCGEIINGVISNFWQDCEVAPIAPIGNYDSNEKTYGYMYGTAVMTGDNILADMGFDTTVWGKKANDVANGIAYYPDLLCFADDEPSTKYVEPTPTVTPAPTTAPGTDTNVTPEPTAEPGATPTPTVAPDTTPDPDDTILYPEDEEAVEQVKNFATRMYTVVLDRTPDKTGINDWTNWLLSHENDGAGIAYGFIMSEEFVNKNLSDEEFIAVLYSTFFDRAADPEGLATWTNLLAQGSSRGFVLSGFVNPSASCVVPCERTVQQ